MGEFLIDLGELPRGARCEKPAWDDAGAEFPAGRPPRPARTMLAAFTVVLTVALAGAAHPAPPVQPAVIPAQLGDTVFLSGDQRHYFVVAGSTAGRRGWLLDRVVSTYRLPEAERTWRTPVVVSGPITAIEAAHDVLLVSYKVDAAWGEATRAYAAATGRVLWRRPARLVGLSADGHVALLADGHGPVGRLHWSGVDVRSGEVVWSYAVGDGGASVLSWDGRRSGPRLVTASWAGGVQVRDMRTGQVIAAAAVRPPAEPDRGILQLWISGGLLLLGGHRGVTAYRLADLRERWRSDLDLSRGFVLPQCGDAICLLQRFGGLSVIDAATGRKRWWTSRWAVAQQAGSRLLVTEDRGSRAQRSLVVLDPATGREEADFGPWQVLGEPDAEGHVVAVRERLSERQVWYALLDPVTHGVRLLGLAEQVTGDCQVTAEVLICRRIDATVGVWPLRTG